ncbi:MAG: DUF4132 domain-containing protein [Firmicutes bacterium]|nr:DUF4132 domain-containing protein [Bacillota bacterium]
MITTISNEPVITAYKNLFVSAGISAEADMLSGVLSDDQKEALAKAQFTAQDLSSLANAVFSYPDYLPLLGNFLNVFLGVKQYSAIFGFFHKAFISRIGTLAYVSKNASQFDMAERTFDRFIEAVRACNIDAVLYETMLFAVLDMDSKETVSKWKRPAYGYLTDLAHSNEREFIKKITSGFKAYGAGAFGFAYERNIEGVTEVLTENYLTNPEFKTRDVWNLLNKRPKAVVEYLNKKLSANDGEKKDIVDMLIGFKLQPEVAGILSGIYHKEKNQAIKKAIIEHIDIPAEIKPAAEHLLTANAERLIKNPVQSFLGLNYDAYPGLTYAGGKDAPLSVSAYILDSYAGLAGSRAYMETAHFKKAFNEASLDAFCKFAYERILTVGFGVSNEWAMLLIIQNTSEQQIKLILSELVELYDESLSDGVAVFISLIALIRPELVSGLPLIFAKNNEQNKTLNAVLVRAMENCGKYTHAAVEAFKDGLLPEFVLNGNLAYEIETLGGTIELRINEDTSIETVFPAGLSENELDTKTKQQIEYAKQVMHAQLVKQLNKLYSAYETGKMQNLKEFEADLKNPLFVFFAERLLWGRYKDGKLIAIFKLDGAKTTTVVIRESAKDENCSICVLHPAEYEGSEYLSNNIKQPTAFNQLNREVFYKENFKPQGSVVLKFNGLFVQGESFVARILNFGWEAGSRTKEGLVLSFVRKNHELGIAAEISISPVSLDAGTQTAVLGELRFYKINELSKHDELNDRTRSLSLIGVPDRFFSNVLYELVAGAKK